MEVTQKELASCIGISARQVRNLKQQGLFELPAGKNKYNLSECVQEYIAFKVEDETGRRVGISKERVSAEHEEIKKQISKIKLRKLKREVHEASDVEAFLTDMLIRFRNKLLTLPPKIAISIVGEKDVNEIIKAVEKMVNDALSELSQYNPDEIDGVTGESDFEDDEEEAEEVEEAEEEDW